MFDECSGFYSKHGLIRTVKYEK